MEKWKMMPLLNMIHGCVAWSTLYNLKGLDVTNYCAKFQSQSINSFGVKLF